MSPPPQRKKDRRPSDPEIYEPDPDYDTKIDIPLPYPATPETAGERREAGRMAVKGESARGRTDISLNTLREKTKTRRFDVETPRKINEINFFESPEIQQERFDALRDVTIVMLANILHANQNIEQKLDLGNFENVAQLRSHMAGIRPGPAENAAFHKILELQQHPNSEVSRHFASEWRSLASAARQVERDMRSLETADLRSRNAPEEKGVISKTVSFVKKHPLISLGIAIAGAYGAYKIFSGIREKLSPAPAASNEKKEGAPEKRTGFMGWLIGAGAAILAIFGLGRFLGRDGVKKFFKEKLGWDIEDSRIVQALTLTTQGKFREAWDILWEGVDENAVFHTEVAKLISKDQKVEVSGKTLFDIRDESFEDFISAKAQFQDEASIHAAEVEGTSAGAVRSLLRFDSKRKNEEQIAIRNFLKKHEATIREIMPIREDTKVDTVLQELYARLTGKAPPVKREPMKPGETPKGPEMLVAPALEAMIASKYPTEKQKVHELAARALGNSEQQKQSIYGKNGLMEKLEAAAKHSPSYRGKVNDINRLYQNLEGKRADFENSIAMGVTVATLETAASEVQDAEEDLIETCQTYAGELQPMMPGWAPLPFFLRRYSHLTPRKRAVVRGQLKRTFVFPRQLKEEFEAGKHPVEFFENKAKQATDELAAYEREHGLSAKGRKAVTGSLATAQFEWRERILHAELADKRLVFEKAKLAFEKLDPKISAATRLAKERALLRAEQQYLQAYQAHFKSAINYAKNFLGGKGSELSDMEKYGFVKDIKEENRRLRQQLNEHRRRVKERVKVVGKESKEGRALVEELDTMSATYRKTVRTELSLWGKIIGNDRGLLKQFREWLNEEREGGWTRFSKGKYGRIIVMGALLAPALYYERKDIKEKDPNIAFLSLMAELGLSAGQLLADVMPLTFGASDWYTVWSGQEFITRKKVQGWERYSRVIWGSFGALLDAASLIPVIDIAGAPVNGIMRLARVGGRYAEGRKLIKLWPRIKEVAEKMGGWKKFGEALKGFREGKGAAVKAGHAAEMTRVAVPRVAAGVVIGDVTYNAIYTAGDDANDPGEEFDPEVISDIERQSAPHLSEPDAPAESGSREAA